MKLSRRQFIASCAGIHLGLLGLWRLSQNPAQSRVFSKDQLWRYGEILPDPSGLLDLPRGFTYSIVSKTGDPMDDGLVVPGMPDGMAAFPGPGSSTILVRNHELVPGERRKSAFGRHRTLLKNVPASKLYDPGRGRRPGPGGTTTVVFDTKNQQVQRQFLSLAGTYRNCAGGPTPWGSWISCEETTQRAGENWAERDHGFNFEIPASPRIGLVDPIPLRAMGRFNHEAVAVDPATGFVYQTEDRGDGLIYRFIPSIPGELSKGGRLQALALLHPAHGETRNWTASLIPERTPLPVAWIDLHDVESPEDDLRYRGHAAGAARFARGEGMWRGNGAIYFACTTGGPAKLGQIWKYTPHRRQSSLEGTLELFLEIAKRDVARKLDNLTSAPWGDLVACEDGKHCNYIVGITPFGRLYAIARTLKSEFAGAAFSPDGSTLFVNIQRKGYTVAITGPWQGSANAPRLG